MGARPEQPEPFLRGCIFPGVSGVPYPRANPADADHLPGDVWAAAQLPVGLRLEFVGDAEAIRIAYETTCGNLGYRGEGAGCTFAVYRATQKVTEVEAVLGEGVVELELYGDADRPSVVYLPEGMRPVVRTVEPVGGSIEPAPPQPRWLAYGDAATQGWLASSPAMAWPAVAGRKLGLDVCNLGYAGSARAETTSAVVLADTAAEVISVAVGANTWSRVPHDTRLVVAEVHAFLDIVRAGHPCTPVVVVSPTVRPDAETSPNRLGATLADLRDALEGAVRGRIDGGDTRLVLVEGARVLGAEDLEDGVYPSDEGHKRLAAAVSKHVSPMMGDLRQHALARRQEELLAASPAVLLSRSVLDAQVPGETTSGVFLAREDAGRLAPVTVGVAPGQVDSAETATVAVADHGPVESGPARVEAVEAEAADVEAAEVEAVDAGLASAVEVEAVEAEAVEVESVEVESVEVEAVEVEAVEADLASAVAAGDPAVGRFEDAPEVAAADVETGAADEDVEEPVPDTIQVELAPAVEMTLPVVTSPSPHRSPAPTVEPSGEAASVVAAPPGAEPAVAASDGAPPAAAHSAAQAALDNILASAVLGIVAGGPDESVGDESGGDRDPMSGPAGAWVATHPAGDPAAAPAGEPPSTPTTVTPAAAASADPVGPAAPSAAARPPAAPAAMTSSQSMARTPAVAQEYAQALAFLQAKQGA